MNSKDIKTECEARILRAIEKVDDNETIKDFKVCVPLDVRNM